MKIVLPTTNHKGGGAPKRPQSNNKNNKKKKKKKETCTVMELSSRLMLVQQQNLKELEKLERGTNELKRQVHSWNETMDDGTQQKQQQQQQEQQVIGDVRKKSAYNVLVGRNQLEHRQHHVDQLLEQTLNGYNDTLTQLEQHVNEKMIKWQEEEEEEGPPAVTAGANQEAAAAEVFVPQVSQLQTQRMKEK